jgi:hypothetical protein
MMIILQILVRLIPALAVAILAWYGWYRVDHWCNTECRHYRTSADTLQQEKQQAQDRATALALLWSEAINRVEVRYVEVARTRSDAAARLRERAGRIRLDGGGVGIRVPVAAVGLLDDASRLANDPPAAGGDQSAPDPVPAPADAVAIDTTLATWIATYLEAAIAYRDAADKHLACVAAYESLSSK